MAHEYLTSHKINPVNQALDIHVQGPVYIVHSAHEAISTIGFHEGELSAEGPSGLTLEVMLAIAIHRLGVYQAKMPGRENALALTKLQEASMWLRARTESRQLRGVEGTQLP